MLQEDQRYMYLILDNIRSEHNVGSMFRTADAAGVKKVYLCGYTPTPIDRFGRENKTVAKVALGAHHTVPWEQVTDVLALITALQQQGVTVAALEQAPNAIDYRSYVFREDMALIVGNEVDGVSPTALAQADVILEIPLYGSKESLNVSVAAGIALFRLLPE